MSTGKELGLGKFGNNGQVNLNNDQLAKGGVRKEDIDQKFKNIFDAFDTDGNQVLTKDEIESLKSNVQSYAKHGNDSIFSNKEAEKMIQQNSVMKDANETAENLFNFLKELQAKAQGSNVVESKVDKDGNAVVTVAEGNKEITKTFDKKNGKDVISTTTVETDANGNKTKVVEKEGLKETYTYIGGKEVLTEKIENAGTENEKIQKIKYNPLGQKESEQIEDKSAGSKINKEYENGVIKKETEESQNSITEKSYNFGKLIKEVVTDKTNNTQKTIVYTSTGRKETVKDSSGKETITEYIGSNRVKTTKDGVTTDITTTDEGTKEVITKDGSDAILTNIKNKSGERLSSTKTVNGQDYTLNYDGNGNITGVVVQFGENIDSICKKYGCTRKELIEANKDLVKTTKGGKQYFDFGETIKVPDKNYKVEPDKKDIQGRKSADEVKQQYQQWKAEKLAREKAEMAYYKQLGVKDFSKKGQPIESVGGVKYTIIGKMGYERWLVRDKKGNIQVMSHDNQILRDDYIQAHKAYMNTPKEQRQKVPGKDGVTFVKNNGKVWYFGPDGKAIVKGDYKNLINDMTQKIATDLDDADKWYKTDRTKVSATNNTIVDPVVLRSLNEHYTSKGIDKGIYKSSYEAYLSKIGLSNSEIYELNADLVNNNAILNQSRRDEILYNNLTTYGKNAANRNKALKSISTRTDYDNLQSNLAKFNKAQGYNSHFKDQDALQTTLYNQTGGDATQIDAANRALIDSNETFLSHDEIIRVQAEVGAMYLEKGDSENATRLQDSEVLAKMDELEKADGSKINVKKNAKKADLIIAGYGQYSDEEVAKLAVQYLNLAIKSYEDVEKDFSNPYMDAQFGTSGEAAHKHQHAEDYGAKALQLIRNYSVLNLVKKELGSKYDEYIAKIKHETKGVTDFSKMQLGTDGKSDLSKQDIDKNIEILEGLKTVISDLEKDHLDTVDGEGWKQDFVNELRQFMYAGKTRADVANEYAMTRSAVSKLELAAKGQLVDANGKPINFEDAVQQLTGKTVQDLQALNQKYVEHQQYGELALDATVGIVTMMIPIPGAGIGKLAQVGGKTYKILQVVNAAKNEYKVVQIATQAVSAGVKTKVAFQAMESSNIATSATGDTIERRGAASDKADEMALNAAAGVGIGGATGAISSKMTSTLGRVVTNATGYAADISSASLITQAYHGGDFIDNIRMVNEDGSVNSAAVMNNLMTTMGYVGGLRGVKNTPNAPAPKVETPNIKPFEETHLAQLGKDGKQVKIGGQKFDLIKQDLEVRLKTANEADLATIQKHVDAITNPNYKSELNSMIEARKAEIQNNTRSEVKLITRESDAKNLYRKNIESRALDFHNPKTIAYAKDGGSYFMDVDGFRYEIYESSGTGNINTDFDMQKKTIKSDWKMHIYADSPTEWANAAQIAMPYLRENKIAYKTLSSLSEGEFHALRNSTNSLGVKSQKGKAFTVYFKSEEEFLKTAKALEAKFKEAGVQSSGKVLNEGQIGDSGFLSYRHEGTERGTQYKPDNIEDPYLKIKSEEKTNFSQNELEFERPKCSKEVEEAFDSNFQEVLKDNIKPGTSSIVNKNGVEYVIANENGVLKIKQKTKLEIKTNQQTLSSDIRRMFRPETQKIMVENLPRGESLVLEKDQMVFVIKNNDGKFEITDMMNKSELCREAGNGGKDLPLNYLTNSIQVRQSFNFAIENGAYTSSLQSYKETISNAHKLAYAGSNGNNLYYMKNGQLLKMSAGQTHNARGLSNNYVEKAQDVEVIAKMYGDKYTTGGASQVKLKGISSDALPQNYGSQHVYPGAQHHDQYFAQMHKTSEEAISLVNKIKNGDTSDKTKKKLLAKIAEHYQYAANVRPFVQINNSLFMNEINTMLSQAGMRTMPHGILDHAAQRLQPDSFKSYFIDQYNSTALTTDIASVVSSDRGGHYTVIRGVIE